jgi:hypothetical protein
VKEKTMTLTCWVNEMTGQRLDRAELEQMWVRARHLYEVNSHLFEDELEALSALGVVAHAELAAPLDSACPRRLYVAA